MDYSKSDLTKQDDTQRLSTESLAKSEMNIWNEHLLTKSSVQVKFHFSFTLSLYILN